MARVLLNQVFVVPAMFMFGSSLHAQVAAQLKELQQAQAHHAAKEYDKALALYVKMIGPVAPPKNVVLPKDQQGWAYAKLVVRKEKALLLEDIARNAQPADRLKKWGEAVQEWVAIQKTFAPQLQPWNAQAPAGIVNVQRGLYFELYVEQKRCSILAFKNLGTVATKGDAEALEAKFASFAWNLHDLQSPTKNPDLPAKVTKQIKEIMESVPEIKAAYEKLGVNP